MHSTHRCLKAMASVALVASLSGCAGLRIHSEVRDKQGAEAKEAWSKVDTAAVIAIERDNLNKLLVTELDTQDKLATAIRDHTLRAIVDGSTVDSLFTNLDAKLKILVGGDGAKKVNDALTYEGDGRAWGKKLLERQEAWDDLRLSVASPNCADLKDDNPKSHARLAAIVESTKAAPSDDTKLAVRKASGADFLEQIKTLCAAEPPRRNAFSEMGGALREAVERRNTDETLAENSKASMSALVAAYKAAAKAYTDTLPSGDASASKRTAEALGKLKEAVAALERAPDALSRQFLSKEKLDALNDFVGAVTQSTTTEKLPDDASKAAIAFVLFPKLVDDAKKSLADAKAPLALPLLIQRNYEQLKLESLTREVAARQAMVRISASVVDTVFEQARQLVLAKQELDTVAPKVKGMTPLNAFKVQDDVLRTSLYRGAALYLDALNRLEARRYKLEYQYIAAQHELQLAYAEVNAKQWSALISTTVDQVAAAGAGGIKADRVVALLNTLGVFYIGHGVNK